MGTIAGFLGVVLCLAAGIVRLSGHRAVKGIQTISYFMVGVGLMVFAILVR